MRRARARTRAVLLWGLLSAIGLTGCAATNLDYIRDERVQITAPRTNETVMLPFELSWTAEDFDGKFAVFFDRSPMRPGGDLRSLVPADDGVCRADPACPDAAWLAARGVYVTEETRLVINVLPDERTNRRQKDRHEVVIVLLDHDDNRGRESAFIREFIIHRED